MPRAVENATVDLRWQLVLGCLGAERAPFSHGALVAFRERLIAHDFDKRLLDSKSSPCPVAAEGARH
jgi:hypothetical protein